MSEDPEVVCVKDPPPRFAAFKEVNGNIAYTPKTDRQSYSSIIKVTA